MSESDKGFFRSVKILAKAKEIHTANGGDSMATARALDGMILIESEIARALHGLGLSGEEIARVLHSPEGCDLSITATANAVRHGFEWSNNEIARVLHSPEGLDLSIADVATVLREKDGCNLFLREVAPALMEGCSVSVAQAARALKDGCRLSDTETAKALLTGCVLTVNEVARALRDGLGMPVAEITKVLAECNFTFEEVARAMYSPHGLNLNVAEDSEPPASYRSASEIKADKQTKSRGIK